MTAGGRLAGAEDAMWADVSEVPTAATRATLRIYVVEKRLWAYLRWLHNLQKIEQKKTLLADLHDIEYKKACAFNILPLCSFKARRTSFATSWITSELTGAQYFDLIKAEE
jgi:hypothetical protein